MKELYKFRQYLTEGVEFSIVLTKDALVTSNNRASGMGVPGSGFQTTGQGHTKVPKGTFLIGLPGGLFAVNMKEKFAFALTGGRRTWLGSQDKLKDNEYTNTSQVPQYSQWKQYLKK